MHTASIVGFAIFVWWFGTLLVLALNNRPRHTYPASLACAAVTAVITLEGIYLTRASTGLSSALAAFTCAVILWGCQEMAFYMGAITGPNRASCEPGLTGWARARAGTLAVLHHELALFGGMLAIAAITWGAANQTATAVYAVLWLMRLSAKLNVFLGVRNLYESFVPPPLRYLISYMRRAPINPLFPLSVAAATAILVLLARRAAIAAPGTDTGLLLVCTMLTLAIVEHGFMILPLPTDKLWRWVLRDDAAHP